MKTIKKDGEYKRISDRKAEEMVTAKGWSYCPKQEWKTNVRDVGTPAPDSPPTNTPEKVEKKKKEKKQEEYKKPNKKDKNDGK